MAELTIDVSMADATQLGPRSTGSPTSAGVPQWSWEELAEAVRSRAAQQGSDPDAVALDALRRGLESVDS